MGKWSNERFVHALSDQYIEGASAAGHSVSRIDIARHEFKPLRYNSDFALNPDIDIQQERQKIADADHVVLLFPLWLGSMPAASRAFFEQTARGEFFLGTSNGDRKWPTRMMKGKSARIVITMGMPSLAYRTLFGGASLKAVERGLFGISGFKPVVHTLYGGVDNASEIKREQWLSEIRAAGYQGS